MAEAGWTYAFVAVMALVVGVMIGRHLLRREYSLHEQSEKMLGQILRDAEQTDIEEALKEKLTRLGRLERALEDTLDEIEHVQDEMDTVFGRELYHRQESLQQAVEDAVTDLMALKGLAYIVGHGDTVEKFMLEHGHSRVYSTPNESVDVLAGDH